MTGREELKQEARTTEKHEKHENLCARVYIIECFSGFISSFE
ncbi:hypothetical protein [Methanosarcina sp.]